MKKEYSLKFNVASSSVQTSDGNKNVSDVFFFALGNGIGAHYEYASFGAITRTSSATHIGNVDIIADNPFRFSSEFYDSELDLVYYNYRHYSPALGRFLSRDPIEEQGGLNLYAFCENNVFLIEILGKISSLNTCFLSPAHLACCLQAGVLSWGSVTARFAGKSGGKELVKVLEKWGGKVISGGKGSHTKVLLPNGKVTIVPNKPANWTVKNILKAAME